MTDSFSPVTATRLEKVAVDNGFDRELPPAGDWLAFASTQTSLRVWLTATNDTLFQAALSQPHVAAGLAELSQPVEIAVPDGAVAGCAVTSIPELHRLVRRAFQLSRTLPDALLHRFEQQVAALPFTTETDRLVVQRIGQDLFREGLIDYWEGRCAITGLSFFAPVTSSRGRRAPATPNALTYSTDYCWHRTWMRPSTVASLASPKTVTCWCLSY